MTHYFNSSDWDEWMTEIEDVLDRYNKEKEQKKTKCECGAEKVKTTHSDWCPKYERASDV